jgi:hypothetical protein
MKIVDYQIELLQPSKYISILHIARYDIES